jgi:hypothetical protein
VRAATVVQCTGIHGRAALGDANFAASGNATATTLGLVLLPSAAGRQGTASRLRGLGAVASLENLVVVIAIADIIGRADVPAERVVTACERLVLALIDFDANGSVAGVTRNTGAGVPAEASAGAHSVGITVVCRN